MCYQFILENQGQLPLLSNNYYIKPHFYAEKCVNEVTEQNLEMYMWIIYKRHHQEYDFNGLTQVHYNVLLIHS